MTRACAAVILFAHQGPAFQAVHLAGLREGLEVLELIPLGKECQLLLRGAPDALEAVIQQLSFADVLRVNLLPEWDPRVENAFYSLEHAAPAGEIVFVESESLGVLLETAHDALKSGLDLVDLKIPRGSVKWGLLSLTGTSVPEGFLEMARARSCLVTRVSQPSAALRKFFAIEP